MPTSRFAGDAARLLLETRAVLFRPDPPFIFTSGRASPVYVDCRRLISFPAARSQLMDMGVELLAEAAGAQAFDAIAGGETAGIPFAAWLAERLDLPMLYVRKQPKGFGRNARIEGAPEPGQRVLLVEDLATDGGSKLGFIQALQDADCVVQHCFVVFHYGIYPESTASLAAAGVQLHALATWADTVAEAEAGGHFAAPVIAEVRAFLVDPVGWSAAHGGREQPP